MDALSRGGQAGVLDTPLPGGRYLVPGGAPTPPHPHPGGPEPRPLPPNSFHTFQGRIGHFHSKKMP
jgi:hypothetical protein